MADYKVFFLAGRRIQRAVSIQAPDDQGAMTKAVALAHGQAVELWQGGRPIAFVRHGGAGAEAWASAPRG